MRQCSVRALFVKSRLIPCQRVCVLSTYRYSIETPGSPMISRTWKRMALVVMPTIAVAIVAVTGAKADPILTVTNGEFTQYSGTTPGTSGDYFTNVMPTSWSGGGNLIFVTTSIQNPN